MATSSPGCFSRLGKRVPCRSLTGSRPVQLYRLMHSAHLLCLDRDLSLIPVWWVAEEYSGMAEPATVFRKKRLTKRRISTSWVRHYLAFTPQFHSWENVSPSLVLPENSSGMRSLLLDTINLSFEFFLAYFCPDQCNTVWESFHTNHIRHGMRVSPVKITATNVDVAMLRSRLWAVQIWKELPKTIYNNKHLYPNS